MKYWSGSPRKWARGIFNRGPGSSALARAVYANRMRSHVGFSSPMSSSILARFMRSSSHHLPLSSAQMPKM
eukprot:9483437-Pyramimonas_sp.AAC.1